MTVNSNNVQANQIIQQKNEKDIEKNKMVKDTTSKEEIYEGFKNTNDGPVAGLPFEGEKNKHESNSESHNGEHQFTPLMSKDYSGINPYVKWLHLYEASHGAYDGCFGLFKDAATSGETIHNAKTIYNTVKDKVTSNNNTNITPPTPVNNKTTTAPVNNTTTNPIKKEKAVTEENNLSKKAKKSIKEKKHQVKKQQNALKETRNRKEYEINRNKYNNNLSQEEKALLKEEKRALKKVNKTKNIAKTTKTIAKETNIIAKETKTLANEASQIHNARALPKVLTKNSKILKQVDISLNETKQVKELVKILEKNGADEMALKLMKGSSSVSVVAIALNAGLEVDNIYNEFQKGTDAGLKQIGRSTLNVGGSAT